MNSLLSAALEHHSAGRAVLPVRENKAPHCGEGWNCWFERRQSESEVRELFSNGAHGLAILLYPASPNIVLDFDGPHSDDAWQKTGIKLIETAKSRTRSGGVHLIYRTPADTSVLSQVQRKVRLVTADCGCAKSCGVDLLLNGYSIEAPTPGYQEDADYPIECAAEIQSEVLELALSHQTKDGSGPRQTGNAAGRVPNGERTNTACSLAGTMRKRGMATEAIRAAIKADSEARYDPPLTEKEIENIVKSSGKWELGVAGSAASQNSYNSQNSYARADLTKPELNPEALCGLAGDIVRAIEPYSESDPVAILANVLTGFGNVVGATPHARVEETEHHLNLFVVQVGDTSKGRKGTGWSTPRKMFRDVDVEWADKRITGGLSSGEGLVYNVRDPRYQTKPVREDGKIVRNEDVLVDKGEEDKRLLLVEEGIFASAEGNES